MITLSVIILAVIQAATEFLPVSSSGHLLAASELFGVESSLGLDVILHLGTLVALIVYFWRDLSLLVRQWQKQRRLIANIIISTVPAALAGLMFRDFIETDARSIGVVIVMLSVVGVIMIAADRLFADRQVAFRSMSGSKALTIGLAQAMALIPGTSRSGITMLGAKAAGMSNEQAARYSFLIGIPIIFGAGMLVLADSETQTYVSSNMLNVVVGVAVSATLGLVVLRFLIAFVARRGLAIFGWYRLALAGLLFIIMLNQ